MALRDEEELALKGLAGFDVGSLDSISGLDSLQEDNEMLEANLDRLTSDGMGGGNSDSIGASWNLFKMSMGGGIDYLDRAYGVPEWIKNYGDDIKSEGEEALQEYYQTHPGTLSEQEHILPWVLERVAEGTTHNAVNLLGLGLASIMFRNPTAGRMAVGTMSAGATTALNFLAQLNEGVQIHASAAGKREDDMNASEIRNAIIPAIENVLLDLYMPTQTTKLFKKTKLNANSLKASLNRLNTEQLETLSKMLVRGAKATLYTAGSEAATEALQGINLMRTSELGLGGVEGEQVLSDALIGGASGSIMASPFNARQATAKNRQLKADEANLDADNIQTLEKAKDQYNINVDNYNKDYEKLVESYVGPGKPSIDLPEADPVTPELFQWDRLEKSKASELGGQAMNALLKRSGESIQDTVRKVKTGKEFKALDDTVRSFMGAESGSGETQSNPSFNTLKHIKYSEHGKEFFDIKEKWQKNLPFTGELFSRVREDIDKYIGARLEDKPNRKLKSAVRSKIGASRMRDLEKDITRLKKISKNVWKDLSATLGKDGLSIGFVKGYLTRGIDRKSLDDPKAQERFLAALVNPELVNLKDIKDDNGIVVQTKDELAQEILNDILNGVNPSTLTSFQIRKGRKREGKGPSSFEKRRDAKWDKLPDEFRRKSPLDSMAEYLLNSSTRIASAQSFGANNANKLADNVDTLLESKVFEEKDAQKVWDLYDAYHNVYKRPQDEGDRIRHNTYKAIGTVVAVKYLGLATISSWTEPAWIPQRVGFINTLKAAPIVAVSVLNGIKNSIYSGGEGKQASSSFGRDLIRLMGFAIDPRMNEKIDKLFAGDNNQMLQTYFRTPAGLFLTQYTNFVRTWTAVAGLKMIQSQAKKLKGLKGNQKLLLQRELTENGMTLKDFDTMIRTGRGKIDIMNDEFLDAMMTKEDGTQTRVRDLLIPWIRKITTDVALEPQAGNRPLWMSNPETQLLAQLKSFPVLFGNTIAKRVVRKMNPKACTPDVMGKIGTLAAVGTALGMAALALAIKDAIKGVDVERGPRDIIGAIGVPYVTDRDLVGTLAGPTLNLIGDFTNGLFEDGLSEMIGGSPEAVFDLILRATVGAIVAEQMETD
tara:strand:- start:168 stop:3494 length:3327 start_codon:yes stop_codon:yes gene_type:complete